MKNVEPEIAAVLAAYPPQCRPQRAEYLGGAGGFSGAAFWRLDTPCGVLCLRRWPQAHPSTDRLEFIQAVLWHVHQEGFRRIPLPLETRFHAGYVRHEGHLWELTPWMPGEADYQAAPSPAKLAAAMRALAEFHVAAASFPLDEARPVASPGVAERLDQLRNLERGGLEALEEAIAARSGLTPLAQLAARIVRQVPPALPRVKGLLTQVSQVRVSLQPCIRDIWHDHVLFEGERVTALIDFGAMLPESVTADVARLLGSLVGDDAAGWRAGLSAYGAVRPLREVENVLTTAFDKSGVMLGAANWLEWLFVDRREFDDQEAVVGRLAHLAERLARLAAG